MSSYIDRSYVDEHAASHILHVSVSKLQKLRAAGEGPYYSKVGRLVRYRTDDLVNFMEENKTIESTDNTRITTNYKQSFRKCENTSIPIETGIPMEDYRHKEPAWHKAVLEAFSKLKVARGLDTDESFFLDERTVQRNHHRLLATGAQALRSRISTLCKKYNEKYGEKNGYIKIATRVQDKPSGIRVWRVE